MDGDACRGADGDRHFDWDQPGAEDSARYQNESMHACIGMGDWVDIRWEEASRSYDYTHLARLGHTLDLGLLA